MQKTEGFYEEALTLMRDREHVLDVRQYAKFLLRVFEIKGSKVEEYGHDQLKSINITLIHRGIEEPH